MMFLLTAAPCNAVISLLWRFYAYATEVVLAMSIYIRAVQSKMSGGFDSSTAPHEPPSVHNLIEIPAKLAGKLTPDQVGSSVECLR